MRLRINDQIINASDVEPTETVLAFLRRSGFTGTKEGCASGDCGACTVMVAQKDTPYHTINACIAPLSQYANHHIVTVEGLADGEKLHPVQQALVDCHGSQCGYCTPGFVMSLAALTENGVEHRSDSLDQVRAAISGNLCRCTGYKPILKAGLQALENSQPNTMATPDIAVNTNLPKGFAQPTSLAELNDAIIAMPGARLIAGGTDLMLEVTQLYREFPGLIDVSQVSALKIFAEQDSQLTMGAALPYSELESAFAARSPQLIRLLHRLGSKQIRNSGTIGGNLANGSPIADMPPILLVWDGVINLGKADGSNRAISVVDFYKGYRDVEITEDEYIVSVTLPTSAIDRFHRFYKNSKRIEDDISSVMGAFSFAEDNAAVSTARIAYGGMAATPIRLKEVEEYLTGNTITDDVIAQAAKMAEATLQPMTDVRASASYRTAMAVQMLTRSLRELRGETLTDITQAPTGASK